ncbi:hypothetical protein FHT86_000836 [Rhizobium sp. BK313]|nr:hypothetical protein [Rhizobium sp. BK313]
MPRLPTRGSFFGRIMHEELWDALKGPFVTRFFIGVGMLVGLLGVGALGLHPIFRAALGVVLILLWKPRSWFKRLQARHPRHY